MAIVWIVKESGRRAKATFKGGRLLYKGLSYVPLSIDTVLDAGGGDALSGAVVGGVLFGGVGAIVGSNIGASRGETAFMLQVASGERFLCIVSKAAFPNLHRLIDDALRSRSSTLEMLRVGLLVEHEIASRGYTLPRLILGPLYFTRYGFWTFLGSSALVVATGGLIWPVLPLWASKLGRRRAEHEISRLNYQINALSSNGKIAGSSLTAS